MADAHKVRNVLAVVLTVAGCLLAPVAVTGAWARTQVTNTDRFVGNVAPLAADTDVRNAVADRVTDMILRNLPDRIANGARGVVRGQVGGLVESDTFQSLWVSGLRSAHGQLVDILTGRGPVGLDSGTVGIELGPFVAAARDRLVASGFSAAQRIPDVHQRFELLSSPDLVRVQHGYRLLDRYGAVLPFFAGGLLLLGLFVAVRRRSTLIGAGLGVAASMVVLGILVLLVRQLALARLPDGIAAATVFDIVTRSLWITLAVVFVVGLGTGLVATPVAAVGGKLALTTHRDEGVTMADGDAWAGVVVKKSRAMYDGSNLYRKLEVQLDSGEVRDVKVKRELWKSLEVGDRLTKEADAEPTRVVI